MIDLERLDKEIDELFEQETCDSLSKWLLSKRFGNINNVVGNGTFIGMEPKNVCIFSSSIKAKFVQPKHSYASHPINRQAA